MSTPIVGRINFGPVAGSPPTSGKKIECIHEDMVHVTRQTFYDLFWCPDCGALGRIHFDGHVAWQTPRQ